MDRDGTKEGFDLELTRAVSEAVEVPVIASGGAEINSFGRWHIKGKANAVLAASIFHFGECTIKETKLEMKKRAFVRL